MDDAELIEEEVAKGFVDHDINDRVSTVKGEAVSKGGIEKRDDAMEKAAREGVRFVFGFGEFHRSDDCFVYPQVRPGGGSEGSLAPFFE